MGNTYPTYKPEVNCGTREEKAVTEKLLKVFAQRSGFPYEA
jgi:hypothetical protein